MGEGSFSFLCKCRPWGECSDDGRNRHLEAPLPFLTRVPSHRPPSTGTQLSQFPVTFVPEEMADCFHVCYCLESQAWPCRQQSHQSLRGQETAFQQPGQSEAHGLQLPHGAGQRQLWEGELAVSKLGGASVEDVGPVGPSLPEDSGAAL